MGTKVGAPGATTALPTLTRLGRLKPREQEGLNRVQTFSSHSLHSPLASREFSLTFLTGTSLCSQTSGLRPTKGGWYQLSRAVGYEI